MNLFLKGQMYVCFLLNTDERKTSRMSCYLSDANWYVDRMILYC